MSAAHATPRLTTSNVAFTGYGHYFPSELRVPEALDAERSDQRETAVVGASVPHSRHVSSDAEGINDLAVEAAQRALYQAGLPASAVDLLILSSWTDPVPLPARAPAVAYRLGAHGSFAFDLNAACLGFVLGVQLAVERMELSRAEVAVVVAADRFSRRVRPGSRGELVCGDGAGAVVLERRSEGDSAIIDASVCSDGGREDVVTVRGRGQWITSREDVADVASESMVARAEEVLERNRLRLDDVSWCVPHSGTTQVLHSLSERLGVPGERVLTNYLHRANTGSATIPSTVSEYLVAGKVRPGDLVLAPAVGAGWYSGALLFRV